MLSIELLKHKAATMLLLSLLAFCFAMILTPLYTYFAYKYKWWKQPRETDVSGAALTVISSMRIKRSLPRMAGVVIAAAVVIVTLGWNLNRSQTWLPLAGLIGGGIIGLIDDIINVTGSGLRARLKLIMITAVAAAIAWFFYTKLGIGTMQIPFVGHLALGWLMIPIFTLVVVCTSNAVNISDGMDGLAGGLLISAYGAYAVIALLQGSYGIAAFCTTVCGALLSYLWFNIPPARFLMGDVGSFSLGTALGVIAMLTDTVFLLPVIALVFVVEAGSSLVQILSKKIFHRKIFIAAPIHHHFEATGWPKTKVTMRFWVIGEVCAVFGIVLALLGGYIR